MKIFKLMSPDLESLAKGVREIKTDYQRIEIVIDEEAGDKRLGCITPPIITKDRTVKTTISPPIGTKGSGQRPLETLVISAPELKPQLFSALRLKEEQAFAYGAIACAYFQGRDWNEVRGTLKNEWNHAVESEEEKWRKIQRMVHEGWEQSSKQMLLVRSETESSE